MLPTPDTSHVAYSRVYEPAEDSFLLLDTLSSPSETAFLQQRFFPPSSSSSSFSSSSSSSSSCPSPSQHKNNNKTAAAPLVVEVGSGSGVVIGFVHAHAAAIFGANSHILTAGVDVNAFACKATVATVNKAEADNHQQHKDGGSNHNNSHNHNALFLGAVRGDLLGPLGRGQVDVLIFNPPYVPTEELPRTNKEKTEDEGEGDMTASQRFERDSYLLSLSYAGGRDGMETTDRLVEALPGALSRRGCAYVLLCAGNKPEDVKARIRRFGPAWRVLTVGDSGKQAGWEKLQVIRIWRENEE